MKEIKLNAESGTSLQGTSAGLVNTNDTEQMKKLDTVTGPLQGGTTNINNNAVSDDSVKVPSSSDPTARHELSNAPVAAVSPTTLRRDELDLARFRVDQDAENFAGGKKLLTTIPIRKPGKEFWVRTHPDSKYWFHALVIELKESGEFYLPEPEVRASLLDQGEKTLVHKLLILSQNRQGDYFLWPIRVPAQDDRFDDWSRSSLEAAARAKSVWVRVVSNKSLGAYEILERASDGVEPKWPDLTMGEVLKIAFKGKLINSLDHPIVCDLLGRQPPKRDVVNEILNETFAAAGAQTTDPQ